MPEAPLKLYINILLVCNKYRGPLVNLDKLRCYCQFSKYIYHELQLTQSRHRHIYITCHVVHMIKLKYMMFAIAGKRLNQIGVNS